MIEKISLKEIKKQIDKTENENEDIVIYLKKDSRIGAQKILKQWQEKQRKKNLLLNKFNKMKEFETNLHQEGYQLIAGIDEVGRGPLAGPVVASSVILSKDFTELGINDSKQLSALKREELFDKISHSAVAIGIGIISQELVDEINIYQATKRAMEAAVLDLQIVPDYLLIDAMQLPINLPQDSIIKGDERSISIAAASIIAKVTRDRLMAKYHKKYPVYGFDKNAGYGTKEHLAAINKYGICPLHRKSFAPIKHMI